MKILPNRREVADWFRQNQTGDPDYIHIPKGHSNAFVGVVAGTHNPTIAVLDFHQVVRNLIAKHNLTYDEAYACALDRSVNTPHYGPFLIAKYPPPPTKFDNDG